MGAYSLSLNSYINGMSIENPSNDKLEKWSNDNHLAAGQPSIDEVDQLAAELVAEYSNPNWRQWYCRNIYRFGIEQIQEWRKRSRGAKYPGKLFSTFVRQAQACNDASPQPYKLYVEPATPDDKRPAVQPDAVINPDDIINDNGPTLLDDMWDEIVKDEPKRANKAVPWMYDDD